jgi:hypothetical protein
MFAIIISNHIVRYNGDIDDDYNCDIYDVFIAVYMPYHEHVFLFCVSSSRGAHRQVAADTTTATTTATSIDNVHEMDALEQQQQQERLEEKTEEAEEDIMEALEQKVLAKMGIKSSVHAREDEPYTPDTGNRSRQSHQHLSHRTSTRNIAANDDDDDDNDDNDDDNKADDDHNGPSISPAFGRAFEANIRASETQESQHIGMHDDDNNVPRKSLAMLRQRHRSRQRSMRRRIMMMVTTSAADGDHGPPLRTNESRNRTSSNRRIHVKSASPVDLWACRALSIVLIGFIAVVSCIIVVVIYRVVV